MPGRPNVANAIRIAGLVAIVLVSIRGAMLRPDLQHDNVAFLFGVPLLTGFLWLTVSGAFGYADARRSDWVGLVPFAVALVVREAFTLHSLQELEIHFTRGPIGRHSVVYPLFQMFFVPFVHYPHRFTMQMNGVLGSFACLAMYLVVRQRVGSRTAGFLCALFLATHPFVSRLSPTDAPYSFLFAAWFSGLALLSAPGLDARSLFGGSVLLGIAATTRIEGVVFLVASLLLLDVRMLLDCARRHRRAAVSALVVMGGLAAVQMYTVLPLHLSGPTPLSAAIPPFEWLFREGVWPASYNDPVFWWLVLIGAVAGILPRYRLGLLAYVAMLVVLAPVSRSTITTLALHRLTPTCALQATVAGIGAYSLTAWISLANRWRWVAAVPGIVAAFYVLVKHRNELTRPYVHTEEYRIVRSHLGPGGLPVAGCTLMTITAISGQDIDIHDFGQVVSRMKTLHCHTPDCLAVLSKGGCFYYFRAAASYFQTGGVTPECAEAGVNAVGDRLACMNEPSATFERSVDLDAIELRTIDILETFPDRIHSYPQKGEVGLFRVRSKRHP